MQANSTHANDEVASTSVAIAAAGPIWPASSRFRIATDAGCVSGEYRNATADTVVIPNAVLRQEGAQPVLADAIEAAHAAP